MTVTHNHQPSVQRNRTPPWIAVCHRWVETHAHFILAVMVLGWSGIFAVAAVYKLNSFWMGFDLGTHEQVLWNTIHGRIAASSPSRGTNSYFGVDIIVTELLFAPLYALWQQPATLLVLQALIVPLGSIPLYLLAVQLFESRTVGLAAAGLYLLALPVQYATLYEFQIRLVGTVCFLWAFWALEGRYGWRFMLFAALALGTRSDAGFALVGIGLYAALQRRGWRWSVLPMIGGFGWVLLCNAVLIPSIRSDSSTLYAFLYGWMGTTPTAMLETLITRPVFVWQHIATFGKAEYLLQLGGPLLFLFLLRPSISMIALPSLLLNLLSADRIHWSIRYHYQAFVLPWLLLATLYAVAQLRQHPRTRRWWRPVLALIILTTILSNLIWRSPLQTLASRPRFPTRIALLHNLLNRIPAGEPVAVSSQFGPFVARRQGFFYFPGNIVYPKEYVERGHWLLVDRAEIPPDCLPRLAALADSEHWTTEYDQDGLMLLRNHNLAAPALLADMPPCAAEPVEAR